MNLTIAYITSRREPKIEWFAASLMRQAGPREISVIIVDPFLDEPDRKTSFANAFLNVGYMGGKYLHVTPKPTVWQGPARLTKEDWWAKSNAHNTAICLCETEWIAFVDDRSVLMLGWLDCIREAMDANEAVCGTYQKRANVKVENSVITDMGTELGLDHRTQAQHPMPTHDWYGGHCALPLEWCLQVNGYSEDLCDSLGLEDAMFGVTLKNNGLPMRYDPRMQIIEDRTQGEIDGALKRSDYGISPNDKSHAIVAKFQGATTSMNSFDIRQVRESVLAGNPFPPPSASQHDWFTGELLSEKT